MGEPINQAASAGPTGDRVRSDLNVAYEPGTGQALAIELTSKVGLSLRRGHRSRGEEGGGRLRGRHNRAADGDRRRGARVGDSGPHRKLPSAGGI